MSKYMVYFTKKAAAKRKMLQTEIFGYSEDDALLRAGIDRDEIESIHERYI